MLRYFLDQRVALVLTSLLAVVFASAVSRVVPANYVKAGEGVLFVLLGLWMLLFREESR